MSNRLPIPGQDSGTWGSILNDFLGATHNSDGSLKASVVNASNIADNAVIDAKVSSVSSSKVTGLAPVATTGTYAALNGSRNHAKVIHGSDPTVPRPLADYVLWEGSVQPNNWINGDDWNETS